MKVKGRPAGLMVLGFILVVLGLALGREEPPIYGLAALGLIFMIIGLNSKRKGNKSTNPPA